MIFNVNSGAGKIPINVIPSTNSSFTYDGEAKSPVWQNFDAQQLTISGADSAVNAGTYTVYFTPKADYEWWDGTSVPKEVSWSIAKAAGSLELSATSGTITGKNSAAITFTVDRAGDGAISVSSGNTAYATASVSGTTVTVTPKGYGTATITVAVAEGTNHTAPGSRTYTVTVQVLYLYNAGNECSSVTGGWTSRGIAIGDWEWGREKGTPVVTRGSSGITIATEVNGESVVLYTAAKINLSGYSTLKYEGTLSTTDNSASWHQLSAWSSFGTYVTQGQAAATGLQGSGSSASLNVSGLNGSYYVGIHSHTTPPLTMKKLWLE